MRVVSYNVRYFGHALKGLGSTRVNKQNIAEALAKLTPSADIIALQEVETRSIRASSLIRGTRDPQLTLFMAELAEAVRQAGCEAEYESHYFPAHAYRVGPVVMYTTGLAIIVNRRTLEVRHANTQAPQSIVHVKDSWLKHLKQNRIAAHLELATSTGHRFHVFNTHVSLPSFWSKDFWVADGRMGFGPNQLVEVQRLMEFARVAARNEPFIIVGDFNTAPATPVYSWLTREGEGSLIGAQEHLKLIDPNDRHGFPTAGFMHWRMHLDHVFGSHGVEFIDMNDSLAFGDERSPFHGLSDHAPLLTTIEIAGKR